MPGGYNDSMVMAQRGFNAGSPVEATQSYLSLPGSAAVAWGGPQVANSGLMSARSRGDSAPPGARVQQPQQGRALMREIPGGQGLSRDIPAVYQHPGQVSRDLIPSVNADMSSPAEEPADHKPSPSMPRPLRTKIPQQQDALAPAQQFALPPGQPSDSSARELYKVPNGWGALEEGSGFAGAAPASARRMTSGWSSMSMLDRTGTLNNSESARSIPAGWGAMEDSSSGPDGTGTFGLGRAPASGGLSARGLTGWAAMEPGPGAARRVINGCGAVR